MKSNSISFLPNFTKQLTMRANSSASARASASTSACRRLRLLPLPLPMLLLPVTHRLCGSVFRSFSSSKPPNNQTHSDNASSDQAETESGADADAVGGSVFAGPANSNSGPSRPVFFPSESAEFNSRFSNDEFLSHLTSLASRLKYRLKSPEGIPMKPIPKTSEDLDNAIDPDLIKFLNSLHIEAEPKPELNFPPQLRPTRRVSMAFRKACPMPFKLTQLQLHRLLTLNSLDSTRWNPASLAAGFNLSVHQVQSILASLAAPALAAGVHRNVKVPVARIPSNSASSEFGINSVIQGEQLVKLFYKKQ